tara:strand:+ start:3594 stop:3782 length:189 start_codon:yes stop_codon:yes gene_type:complete
MPGKPINAQMMGNVCMRSVRRSGDDLRAYTGHMIPRVTFLFSNKKVYVKVKFLKMKEKLVKD